MCLAESPPLPHFSSPRLVCPAVIERHNELGEIQPACVTLPAQDSLQKKKKTVINTQVLCDTFHLLTSILMFPLCNVRRQETCWSGVCPKTWTWRGWSSKPSPAAPTGSPPTSCERISSHTVLMHILLIVFSGLWCFRVCAELKSICFTYVYINHGNISCRTEIGGGRDLYGQNSKKGLYCEHDTVFPEWNIKRSHTATSVDKYPLSISNSTGNSFNRPKYKVINNCVINWENTDVK